MIIIIIICKIIENKPNNIILHCWKIYKRIITINKLIKPSKIIELLSNNNNKIYINYNKRYKIYNTLSIIKITKLININQY